MTKSAFALMLKLSGKKIKDKKAERDEKMTEDVIITEKGGKLTALLKCELDHYTAKRIREKIDPAVFRYRPDVLVLDFSCVRFMDSSGIGLIMGRVEKARMEGAEVRLVGLSKSIRKLVLLSGLNKIDGLRI